MTYGIKFALRDFAFEKLHEGNLNIQWALAHPPLQPQALSGLPRGLSFGIQYIVIVFNDISRQTHIRAKCH